jgi:hypothetical protein
VGHLATGGAVHHGRRRLLLPQPARGLCLPCEEIEMREISVGEVAMLVAVWGVVGVAWLLDSGRFPIIGKRVRDWLYDR